MSLKQVDIILYISLILLLFSHTISTKAIKRRHHDDEAKEKIEENIIDDAPIDRHYVKEINPKTIEATTEQLQTTTNHMIESTAKTNRKTTVETIADQPILAEHPTGNDTEKVRNQRTIGRLREVENPLDLIQNFRSKLKNARNNMEEMERKIAEPKIFIYDPNERSNLANKLNLKTLQLPIIDKQENSPINTDKARSQLSDNLEIIKSTPRRLIVTHKTPAPQFDENTENPIKFEERNNDDDSKSKEDSKEMEELIKVRDEITNIRHTLQQLKEQQLAEKFGAHFPNAQNLTAEQKQALKEFVDQLKAQGKISTQPLNDQSTNDSSKHLTANEIARLKEDIQKLKQTISELTNVIGSAKSKEEALDKLEQLLVAQKSELEHLKSMMDRILPEDFPRTRSNTEMRMPNAEKAQLNQELNKLQSIINNLTNKDKVAELRKSASSNIDNDKQVGAENKQIPKNDDDIETLMKLFQTISQPNNNVQQKSVQDKIDKLERELKELDDQNRLTRQELMMEKLQREIKNLRGPIRDKDIADKIRKLEENMEKHVSKTPNTIEDKIHKLEKQIKQMSAPNTHDFDVDDNVERNLDQLQREIEKLSKKNEKFTHHNTSKAKTEPASNRQLDIFSDILDDPNIDTLNTLNNHENTQHETNRHLQPEAPVKHNDGTNHQVYTHPHVFQLPFCLQKNTHEHQTFPYPPPVNNEQHIQNENIPNGSENSTVQHPTFPYPSSGNNEQNTQQENIPNIPEKSTIKYDKPASNNNQQTSGQKYEKPVHSSQSHGTNSQINQLPQQNTNKVPASFYPYPGEQQQFTKPAAVNNFPEITDNYKPLYNSKIYNVNVDEEMQRIQQIISTLQDKIAQYPNTQDKINQYSNIQDNPNQYVPEKLSHYPNKQDKINPYPSKEIIEHFDPEESIFDDYAHVEYRPRKKRSLEGDNLHKQDLIKDIRERLSYLKENVQKMQEQKATSNESDNIQRTAYNDAKSEYYQPTKDLKLKRTQKFDDLFIKIVKFILHKLEISAPYVVESLFNGDVFKLEPSYEPDNYSNDYYRSNNNEKETEDSNNQDTKTIQNGFAGLFNNFQGFGGLLGFIPTILFKLLSNFSSFLNILKRNTFFKNFLFPGALILVVDGIMALLVWWFSSDDSSFNFNSNQGFSGLNQHLINHYR